MAKKGVFSSRVFSKEQNEEINKKINTWTKKKLVQFIYDFGRELDKNTGTTEITEALESFDSILREKRMWRERNKEAWNCLNKWKNYRKNLLLWDAKLRMKKDGTKYLADKRGTREEFAREYAKQILKKIKKNNIAEIKWKLGETAADYDWPFAIAYILKQRYNVRKPKEPSCCYKSIEEIPCSDAALKAGGLESCTKASLKRLLKVMIECETDLLSDRIDIDRVFAIRWNYKDSVYYVSKKSYKAIKSECADRVQCIEQMQKRCQKLEAMIERKINRDL